MDNSSSYDEAIQQQRLEEHHKGKVPTGLRGAPFFHVFRGDDGFAKRHSAFFCNPDIDFGSLNGCSYFPHMQTVSSESLLKFGARGPNVPRVKAATFVIGGQRTRAGPNKQNGGRSGSSSLLVIDLYYGFAVGKSLEAAER